LNGLDEKKELKFCLFINRYRYVCLAHLRVTSDNTINQFLGGFESLRVCKNSRYPGGFVRVGKIDSLPSMKGEEKNCYSNW
jgi:hypothetical protein